MIKPNVNIVNFDLLYEILDEIKEHLPFSIKKYENVNRFTQVSNKDLRHCLIIVNSNINQLKKENLLIFDNLPISLSKIVELININLIKLKFNYQSKITINNYQLNLNSKFISKNQITLKLTEKEIQIILLLGENKKKYNILDLQKTIWGYTSDLETHTVETHIYRLRKKIDEKFNDKNFITSHIDGYFIQ